MCFRKSLAHSRKTQLPKGSHWRAGATAVQDVCGRMILGLLRSAFTCKPSAQAEEQVGQISQTDGVGGRGLQAGFGAVLEPA